MAYNFIHRILNAVIPPPESSWDKIASTLDKAGPGFVEKLSQAAIEPPATVWYQIAAVLDAAHVERKGGIIAGWMRWSAAAITIGIIIVSAFYFFYINPSTKNIATTTSAAADKTSTS